MMPHSEEDRAKGQDSSYNNHTLFGGLSLIAFLLFVLALTYTLFMAADFSGQAIGGIVAIVTLIASYAFNRAARH